MPFVKGDSRINRNGRPKKGKSVSELLHKIGKERTGLDNRPRIELLARKLWDMALDGDIKAITALMDRMDGKPRLTELSTDGSDLNQINVVYISPEDAEV